MYHLILLWHIVSLDLKASFTKVPLEYTTDLVPKQIYENHEISMSITKNEMREISLLCNENAHFTCRDTAYLQIDGMSMCSPLGPTLVKMFIVHLERSLVPLLAAELSIWKQYVDDTITFINFGTVDQTFFMLNNFYCNIQLTFETENDLKLAFLIVMICWDGENIAATVYQKVTNVDVYLNWHSLALDSWSWRTLKLLTLRAYIICSTTELLGTELKHLEGVFVEENNHHKWIIRMAFSIY